MSIKHKLSELQHKMHRYIRSIQPSPKPILNLPGAEQISRLPLPRKFPTCWEYAVDDPRFDV
jgi:hypothetical protein